jgi:hypothetical protein
MTNLPVALDPENDAEEVALYEKIGENLKKKFTGFQFWALCPETDALNHINLKTLKKLVLLQNAAEFHLEKFELSEDSVRTEENDVAETN